MLDTYEPEPMSGCWLWTGRYITTGYGALKGGVTQLAHRAMWRAHHGEIPRGLFVLHRCDVRCCVNPAHLFLGTAQDNTKDMVRKGRHWAPPKLAACRRGHPYDAGNTRQRPGGRRTCRTCSNEAAKMYQRRKRAKEMANALQLHPRDGDVESFHG